MRAESLSTANAGMTRLRRKGKASPATLFDCLNAYITIAGSVKPRPGAPLDTVLPANTKGLVAHKGKLVVFSHLPVTMTDPRYQCVTLRHPTNPTAALRAIHFAKPFMGYLYVVAAFEDGFQWHYWAEELDAWKADTIYVSGERVFSVAVNGFAYKATRSGSPAAIWAAGVQREVGDVIEPTVPNGYQYTVESVTGEIPASGDAEPVWPASDGATVIEESIGGGSPTTPTPSTDPNYDYIDDRYNNPNFGGGYNRKYRTRLK